MRWWPVIAVSIGFAVWIIGQAPAAGFALLAALLGLGTALYTVAGARPLAPGAERANLPKLKRASGAPRSKSPA
jgi:hypothetical protein